MGRTGLSDLDCSWVTESPLLGRLTALDLSGNSPGAYLLRLQVTPRAGPPVAVERRIRVVAPT